jgi:phage terminase large subunit
LSILSLDVPRALKPLLAPKRYKGAYGGRGGAKSHFFAEQIVARCYARKTRAVCIREVQNSLRESVRQLIIDKIAKMGLEDFFEVAENEIRGKNGSLIIFKGMQAYNAETIKSLEGFDVAWVEEAQTLSAVSLRMLRPTIRNDDSELWFSWNPRHKFDPVDDFFRGKNPSPEAISIPVSWADNPWFPDVLRKEKDDDYAKDPVMAQHVWGGDYEIIAEGSYYAKLLAEAEQDARIGRVPYDPILQVYTAWDLGIGDSTAIWFAQVTSMECRIIDYYEASGVGLDHYAKLLRSKPYAYVEHLLPHDVMVSDLSTGKTRYQTLASLGINARALPRDSVDDGVNAVRNLIPCCWFDSEKCEHGLDALRLYRREYDDKLRMFKERPLHDWTSHAADAFRYLARGLPNLSYSRERQRYSGRHSGTSDSAWMTV